MGLGDGKPNKHIGYSTVICLVGDEAEDLREIRRYIAKSLGLSLYNHCFALATTKDWIYKSISRLLNP